jgi:hypothetical protein
MPMSRPAGMPMISEMRSTKRSFSAIISGTADAIANRTVDRCIGTMNRKLENIVAT